MAKLAVLAVLAMLSCVARTTTGQGYGGGYSPPISVPPSPSPSSSPSPPTSSPPPPVVTLPPSPSPTSSPSPPPPTPSPPPVALTPSPSTTTSPSPPPPTPSPPPPAPAVLKVGYYKQKCYYAENIVRKAVQSADPGIMAGLIRLFFHDCFVRGCDASVLLDPTTANPQPEKLGAPNFPSLRGFEVIDAAKARLEKLCPGVVSCADIVAFAGRDATYFLSDRKVYFDMPAGRYDGRVSFANETLPNLPPPFATVQRLKDMFAAKGLNTDDMVTLSGAHTVGRSHCSSFSDRLPPNKSDMNRVLKASLVKQCPTGNSTVVQDVNTPNTLDNMYYKNVRSRNVLFASDAALLNATDTSVLVRANAMSQRLWQDKFKAAMVKMGAVEVKTAADGEIRKLCRFVN